MKRMTSRTGARRPWCLAVALVAGPLIAVGCKPSGAAAPGVGEQAIADAVFDVLSADRETYAEEVVHRLQNVEKVFKASEQWREDKLLPLPAQMFRMGAERARKRSQRVSYALLSLWPINKQNGARTDAEKQGLQAVIDRPEQAFYKDEELAGARYLTAVYPDRAVSQACVNCHNAHGDSPRKDFKMGQVMGGIVVRVARR
jgi:Protein of unknown function (DUF3365)